MPQQQYQPDPREVLSILQYYSPEAQQQRQLELQQLQGQMQTQQAQAQHLGVETDLARGVLGHQPMEFQNQDAMSQLQQKGLGYQNDAALQQLLFNQQANPGKLTAQTDEHNLATVQAGHIKAETDRMGTVSPQELPAMGALFNQAQTHPELAQFYGMLNPQFGNAYGPAQAKQEQALQGVTDLANQTKTKQQTSATQQSGGLYGLGQTLGNIPGNVANVYRNYPHTMDQYFGMPGENFLNGLVGKPARTKNDFNYFPYK